MTSDDGQKFDIFTKINQNPVSKDKDNKKGKKELTPMSTPSKKQEKEGQIISYAEFNLDREKDNQ